MKTQSAKRGAHSVFRREKREDELFTVHRLQFTLYLN